VELAAEVLLQRRQDPRAKLARLVGAEIGLDGAQPAGVHHVIVAGGAADDDELFAPALAGADPDPVLVQREPGDPAVILYTSGTTGRPPNETPTSVASAISSQRENEGDLVIAADRPRSAAIRRSSSAAGPPAVSGSTSGSRAIGSDAPARRRSPGCRA
jgi:acyl-CoA synthetase (AMP-forming)/AMP-acid ligase II